MFFKKNRRLGNKATLGSHAIFDPDNYCDRYDIDLATFDFFNSKVLFPGSELVVRSVEYNNKEHICLSKIHVSIKEIRAYYYVSKYFFTYVSIFDTPHFFLANSVINKSSDFVFGEEQYKRYMRNQHGLKGESLKRRLDRFLRLIDLVVEDFQADLSQANVWGGQIYGKFKSNRLIIADGFHRAAIIASLGYKTIPVALVVKTI